MSEVKFKSLWGRAAFDADERDYNGGKVQSVSVTPITSTKEGFTVRVTLWPELGIEPVKQGDLVFANGKYEQVTKGGNVYHNLSANEALVFAPKRAEKKQVVNKKSEKVEDTEDDLF